MPRSSAYSPGDKIGDHWTVVAVVSPKTFIVDCSCGARRMHTLTELHPRGRAKQQCGHGINA